jgi:hypothetical protein
VWEERGQASKEQSRLQAKQRAKHTSKQRAKHAVDKSKQRAKHTGAARSAKERAEQPEATAKECPQLAARRSCSCCCAAACVMLLPHPHASSSCLMPHALASSSCLILLSHASCSCLMLLLLLPPSPSSSSPLTRSLSRPFSCVFVFVCLCRSRLEVLGLEACDRISEPCIVALAQVFPPPPPHPPSPSSLDLWHDLGPLSASDGLD